MISSEVFLTFDVDWASDEILQEVLDLMVEARVKSTWFITHDTPLLDFFRSHSDLFELGIHPNFLDGTTHGNSEEEILKHLMDLVPEAEVVRSHSVFQSGQLLAKYAGLASIRLDSSIFLPEMSHIDLVTHLTPNGALSRIPIFWADDYELLKSESDWNPVKYFNQPGYKVFLFHPIHIYLNTLNFQEYEEYKKTGYKDSETELGVALFFNRLLGELNSRHYKPKFLKDLL